MTRRIRIRFRKEGDLRLISHRDLLRTFERLFRRAGLRLSLSAGFHPKPKLMFPSALSLGVQGLDEVMEVTLEDAVDELELVARLQRLAPRGLTVTAARTLDATEPKAQLARAEYELPLPAERITAANDAVQRLLARAEVPIRREGRSAPIDLRAALLGLEVDGRLLRMQLRVDRDASVRPREVLAALGLDDLEDQGRFLTRTRVELVG